jgi:hypothetical protein
MFTVHTSIVREFSETPKEKCQFFSPFFAVFSFLGFSWIFPLSFVGFFHCILRVIYDLCVGNQSLILIASGAICVKVPKNRVKANGKRRAEELLEGYAQNGFLGRRMGLMGAGRECPASLFYRRLLPGKAVWNEEAWK